MPNMDEIGTRLRKLRGKKSLEEVSKEIGITFQALSNYEQGIRSPRDQLKKKLADYYKTSVQEIFFD